MIAGLIAFALFLLVAAGAVKIHDLIIKRRPDLEDKLDDFLDRF